MEGATRSRETRRSTTTWNIGPAFGLDGFQCSGSQQDFGTRDPPHAHALPQQEAGTAKSFWKVGDEDATRKENVTAPSLVMNPSLKLETNDHDAVAEEYMGRRIEDEDGVDVTMTTSRMTINAGSAS